MRRPPTACRRQGSQPEAAVQDKDLSVDIVESATGFVCTRVHSSGHPSTYAALKTPTGAAFTPTPPDFDGGLEGCVMNFVFPSPDGPTGPSVCSIAYRHAGNEVAMAMSGSAEWLREKRPKEELVEAFKARYPHVPQLWLEEMADFLHSKKLAEDLRIRCLPMTIGSLLCTAGIIG